MTGKIDRKVDAAASKKRKAEDHDESFDTSASGE
jgi:hypothetical protein